MSPKTAPPPAAARGRGADVVPPAKVVPSGKVHAWRIERQLLAGAQAASPQQVAAALVGVQAQVTSSAALAIALRSAGDVCARGSMEATGVALRERRLVRSWAMRGTLHLFAADDVPTIAAALGNKESWRRPAWLRWFGVDEREMEALIDGVGEILDDGRPRTRAELAEEIGGRLGDKAGKLLLGSWGSALKVASDRHYLVQSAEDEAGVRFVKASRWVAAWRVEDQTAALASLIGRYLAAYGPASFREIRRWWGAATVKEVLPAMEILSDRVAEIEVGGTRAYVRKADLAAIEAAAGTKGAVHLVGGFDPFIVGAGLRDQLLPAAHLKRVSRTAGWISPVVLVDGIAAGVWDSRRTASRLAITVEMFAAPSASLRRAIDGAAQRVAGVQGLTLDLRFGPVFTEKGPPLVITSANA